MNGRRAVVGLCMLCALLVSAFAAQSASASKGTTAFTCVKEHPSGPLWGEHCLESGSAPTEKYKHVAIAQDTTTEVTATAEKTASNTTLTRSTNLKMTIAGVVTELKATSLHGEGSLTNKVEPVAKGEHYAEAHGTITYTEVSVVKPAGLGCKVYTSNEDTTKGTEGLVHTTPLKGSTTEEQNATDPKHNVKIEPTTAGGVFAHFIIEGCKAPVEALNGPYTVSGSVTCPVKGATIECDHNTITTANTLKVNGAIKAGIEGALTLKNKISGTPISATTVETN
jgi:hypothetical protein